MIPNSLRDMLLYYAEPWTRAEMVHDLTVNDGQGFQVLVGLTEQFITEWRPQTDLQWEYVRLGRHLDWMVWRMANSMLEGTSATWNDVEALEPWGIHIETLPRYPNLPAPVIAPEEPFDPETSTRFW